MPGKGAFSEVRIQPVASLCVRAGSKPHLRPARNRTLPQDVLVVHLYSGIVLSQTGAMLYAGPMRSATDASTNGSTDRLTTVVEAAEILGITPDAVRSRLRRGTLNRSTERGEEGEVLVVMSAPRNGDQSRDQSETVGDQSGDQSATDRATDPTVAASLVERMASEIDHLRSELALERESSSELRRIIAAMTQRVPVVELEAPPAPRGGHETTSESTAESRVPPEPQEPSQRRSCLYRFFFGP